MIIGILSVQVSADYLKYSNGDKHIYYITANATGRLNIKFDHKYSEQGLWFYDVYKMNKNGSKEFCFNRSVDADGDVDYAPGIGCKKDEVYCIEVDGTHVEDVYYQIYWGIDKLNYEKEFNNTFYTANSLQFDKKLIGNCWDYNDNEKDYYKIVVPFNGTLNINFNHYDIGKSFGWTVSLYKQNSNKLFDLVVKKYINNTSSHDFTINKAKKNQVFYLKVVWEYSNNWHNNNYLGTEYFITPKMKANKPGSNKVSIKKGKVSIKWSKASSVTGYQVQICKKSNFKKLVVNNKQKKSSYSKTLKRKTKYYVRIRSYKKVGSKIYYSSWNSRKSFKTK